MPGSDVQVPVAVSTLADILAAFPWVTRVVLFGSRARGTARPRSDIDIAVEAAGAGIFEWDRVVAAVEDSDTLLERDLIRLDESPADVRAAILREGVTLFERAPSSATPVELRAGYRERLGEALTVSRSAELAVDGTIQRFEFAFELAWKTLKAALEGEGIDANTPRTVIEKAYAVGWIADERAWLQMLADRNLTSHTYDETRAIEIYERVRSNFPAFTAALGELRPVFARQTAG